MLVSILDETKFMVGSKTYKVGDKLNLDEFTQPVVFPCGQMSVVELNKHMTKVAASLRQTRMDLLMRLHTVVEDYDEGAANLARQYESLERDWLFYSDVFYQSIQEQMGGMLPLVRNPQTGEISIRAKQPQETLNHLRDICSQRVRFYHYEGMRLLALHLAGGSIEDVKMESEIHINARVPVVSTTATPDDLLQWLEDSVSKTYDDVTKYGAVAGIAWVTESGVYFLNATALLKAGNNDPKLALTTAIQRCQPELPKPVSMGFFIYGNMPVVDEKARGVLISTITPEGGKFKILVVGEDQKLSVAKEGDEAKIAEEIVALANQAMEVPKEDPKAEEEKKEE
jgi:hypothetical protein